MRKILLVCTGNTCRSPMAEFILRDLLKRNKYLKGKWQVISAGITALPGGGPNEKAVSVLDEEGIDLEEHLTSPLTEDLIRKADLILTMTAAHKEMIREMIPDLEFKDNLFTLKEFNDGVQLDIFDPFGQSVDIYRQTRDEIKEELKKVIGKLSQSYLEEGDTGLVENNNNRSVNNLKIAIGSDHAGYDLKMAIIKLLKEEGFDFEDMGTDSTESVDYPDFAFNVASGVGSGDFDRGILICGTGIGMSISANKIKGVRAALCHDVFSARATRNHNNSNVLTMGSRVIGSGLAEEIVKIWLGADFDGGRHARRINKIDQIERGEFNNE